MKPNTAPTFTEGLRMRPPSSLRWSALAGVSALLLIPAASFCQAEPPKDEPADAKPADSKPADAKPADAKPADAKSDDLKPSDAKPVSFMKDVAPILVRNCIACHNPKKPESKYVMTTFAQLAKGGKVGEGITLEPGKPDESYLIEVLGPDASPRMPYKQDPLPPEDMAILDRWVSEGAKYDGVSDGEDWTFLLRKTQKTEIPEAYPATVPVTAVQFTPDGQKLEASGYHELTTWKTADGALDGRIQGLPERTYDVAFSKDGKWMATAGGDPGQYGVARLWELEAGKPPKPVRDLAEAQDAVFAVAFSPDGQKIATAGADRAVRVHETATGKVLVQIEDHADWIYDVAFSPDGKLLATASRDKTSKVFDVEKKESLVTFTGHAQTVYAVLFAPDGKSVLSGGEDNRIRYWSIDGEAKQTRQIGSFGGPVFTMALSPDGKTLAASGADKVVRTFDAANGSSQKKLEGNTDWVYTLAISPDGQTIASGSWNGEIRLWNLADGKPVRDFIAAPGFKPAGAQASR
jgi:dipeptidyl aminopeptidase/acylaminoacyl peptidase